MLKIGFLALVVVIISGCVSVPITGKVSTALYEPMPSDTKFIVVPPDQLSLTDRNIAFYLEKKLIEIGYKKASQAQEANVAVMFRYSIGSASTHVSSSPDYVWGGQSVQSTSQYPRYFQVVIIDIRKSKIPENLHILWQGEIFSPGVSANMADLAPAFIDVLVEKSGKNTTNERFLKVFR